MEVEKTGLHQLLSQPIPYDEVAYRTLLKQAAAEIVDNLRIALEYPTFDKFVLHVTGGMDTRAVLCALTHLPWHWHRIFARTVKALPLGDFDIAMKVLSKFRLPFGPVPLKIGVPYRPDWDFESLSLQLGVTPDCGAPAG